MTSRTPAIRVLIADDNRFVRKGLRVQLDAADGIQVIGEVGNGIDAVSVARAERADVVLMDLQMPGMSGLRATRELSQTPGDHRIAIIVMTSYSVDHYVTEALDAGAVGYLLKSYDSDQVVAGIHAAFRGEALMSSRVTAPLLQEFTRRGGTAASSAAASVLTASERRVVSTLAGGITSSEAIAQHLHITIYTVRSHLQSALRKLGLEDRTQLALWGASHGLHRPPRVINIDELSVGELVEPIDPA
jgi:DNA-binding NarL/FixJ family response regulator